MRIPFGRYEGRTLEEIAETDLDYLRWLLREEVGSDELRAEAARLLEERTYVLGPSVAPVGRFPAWAWGLVGTILGALLVLVAGQVLGPGRAGVEAPPPTAEIAAVGGQQSAVMSVGTPVVSTQQPEMANPTPRAFAHTPLPPPTKPVTTRPGTPSCENRPEGVLAPDEVADHLGEYRPVQFRVVRTYNSGKAVFLNSHDPWRGYFEVVIFPEHWDDFPQPPEVLFLNRCIVVYGRLQVYKDTPEIVLQSADHIRMVE
jgi:hypothetical protein